MDTGHAHHLRKTELESLSDPLLVGPSKRTRSLLILRPDHLGKQSCLITYGGQNWLDVSSARDSVDHNRATAMAQMLVCSERYNTVHVRGDSIHCSCTCLAAPYRTQILQTSHWRQSRICVRWSTSQVRGVNSCSHRVMVHPRGSLHVLPAPRRSVPSLTRVTARLTAVLCAEWMISLDTAIKSADTGSNLAERAASARQDKHVEAARRDVEHHIGRSLQYHC